MTIELFFWGLHILTGEEQSPTIINGERLIWWFYHSIKYIKRSFAYGVFWEFL